MPASGGIRGRGRTVMIMTTEKVAVVTGAGSGLGRLITIALADQGWYVVAAGRRFELLEDTVQQALPEMVLPVQAASRFSRKAATPSRKSLEPPSSPWMLASSARCSGIRAYSQWLSSRLLPA